jgi:hypothetical protein
LGAALALVFGFAVPGAFALDAVALVFAALAGAFAAELFFALGAVLGVSGSAPLPVPVSNLADP